MEHEVSSGNVYADLGYDDPEIMRVRARIAMAIAERIEREGWTRREAAKWLSTTPAALDDVVHGRVRRISTDRLIRMLAAAGHRVTVTVDQ